MVVAGILVLLTIPLIPLIIPSLAPSSAQAGLQALESQGAIYGATWALYLVSDLLYLVSFFALYRSLNQAGKGVAKAAVSLNTAFVVLDVGLDIPLRLWLVGLSSSYASAAGNQQQIVDSANFALSASNEVALLATLLQFAALILISTLMAREPSFGKRAAYLGVATGIVALLFIPAFAAGSQAAGLFNIAGFALLGIWSILVGLKLRRTASAR